MRRCKAHIDSLKRLPVAKTIYPFNPNFISDQRVFFDLSTDEIDRLHRFRQTGIGLIQKEKKFQEVTKVDNVWMHQYGPYFQFPVFTKTLPSRPKQKKSISVH